MDSQRSALTGFYQRYLQRCNEHRFDDLQEFVDQDVRGSNPAAGFDSYVAGLYAVVGAFPDYHWDLQHLLIDGEWLSARLLGTGTHSGRFLEVPATGRTITTQELVQYRVKSGKIVECWGDLGSTVRDELTFGAPGV